MNIEQLVTDLIEFNKEGLDENKIKVLEVNYGIYKSQLSYKDRESLIFTYIRYLYDSTKQSYEHDRKLDINFRVYKSAYDFILAEKNLEDHLNKTGRLKACLIRKTRSCMDKMLNDIDHGIIGDRTRSYMESIKKITQFAAIGLNKITWLSDPRNKKENIAKTASTKVKTLSKSQEIVQMRIDLG
jgi:hypothetical protein